MKKKFTLLIFAILASLGAMASPPQQDDGNVAKVGSMEYATIEEAIAAWGPGKTLTLLNNVTTTSTVTVEVNATKSTQNWTLDLGDYTWTASGCNAFQLYAAGETVMNQNYGLKIYANQSGGITASGKYCIECKYDNSKIRYRPRLEIHGGTYNGSYVVFYKSLIWQDNNVENGPSTHIFKSNDGTEPIFNGNFAMAKCPLTIYAGYFNGSSFNTYPVGSTADTYLNGGHFKTISAFPSANNNKGIIFGNYKVFVKSDASIDVVNGAPAVYEAKATKSLLLSSNQSVNYSDYVYYEKANDAITKYSSGTIEIILSEGVTASTSKSFRSGTLTIDASAEGAKYTGNITLTGSSAKFVTKFPEGGGHYGVSVSTGQLHVEETIDNGIVTRTYSVKNVTNPEAKVGNTGYSTVYDAFFAVDGSTDNKVIVLQKDVTDAGIVTNGTAVNAAGKTVATFDLNGKSIGIGSVAAGNNADYTLTIIDSSTDKTGIVTNSDASLFVLALTGINDYSGSYTLKIQAGTWHFNPSAVVIKGETHDLVDEGYVARDNGDGTWTVGEIPYVAQYNGQKYRTLQAAFDAAEADDPANIVIDLLDDATLDITARANVLSIGTENTATITINGNGHTLDFNKKNSDWNDVSTANDAQTKLILNNIKLTDSGYNDGPWNRYDINFSCAVELNNVTSDKALALKNHATLNNVTINEVNNTSDVYGIWVSPQVENQTITIDGLNLTSFVEGDKTGRGIKVDHQYNTENTPKVILSVANSTFTTEKKAAILLLSNGGVDVIDGGGNNIEGVAADKVNLVWVDEGDAENFYRYSVTGATMVPESKETDYVARLSNAEGKILGYYNGTSALANAVAASDAGYTVTIFKAGAYTMPGLPKNITVEGGVDGVVFNHTSAGNIAAIPNGATFKNVSFNFGNVNYHGFQSAGTINMENCKLSGKFFSYGEMNFTGCEFTQTNADYNMWTYAGNVTYTDCTFKNTTTGKFLNVYNESGATKYTVTVNNCTFINEGASNKAALNVKASCDNGNVLAYDVFINNCSTEGAFPAAAITQKLVVLNNLAQVDDRTSNGVDNITVTHDGVLIYPFAPVAKIGEIGYPTLQSAVDAATVMGGDVTINIVADITGETVTIKENANLQITIDGKKDDSSNYTVDAIIVVDGLRGNGGSNTNGASVTLQNIAFVRGDYLTTQNADVIQPCHYPHHLTIQDCTYTGTDTDTSRDKWFLNVSDAPMYNATIKNVTVEHSRLIQGNLGMDVVFENITAINDIKSGFNIKTEGTVLIKNCQITTPKYALRDYKDAYVGTITLEGNTFISTSTESDEGAIVNRGGDNNHAQINVISGIYVGDIKALNGKEAIVISGGHFSAPLGNSDYAQFIAEGKSGVNGIYLAETPQAPNGLGDAVAELTDAEGKVSNYASLEAAFGDATDGSTIKLLVNSNGNGIVAPEGKFSTDGLTVDFNGKTYTVDGTLVGSTGTETQAFQLLKDNNITFKGGTIYSENALFLVQNYSNLTLKDMTLTLNNENYASGYTLSNNNGNVTIDNSTINANQAGGFAFDVCRYSSYPSVSVTVKGGSQINGDVEVSASGNDAMNGFLLMLESGKINGDIVLDASAKAAMAATPDKALVREYDTFNQEPPAEYMWQNYEEGKSQLVPAVYVAQIGDVKYTSLAKAVAAVPADGTETTIQMIADHDIKGNAGVTIPATKNVVLDLNGKTIRGCVETGTSAQTLLNVGTLTITDSSEGESGVIKNAADEQNAGEWPNRNWATNVITNTGTLTIAGGTIVNEAIGSICYAIDNNSTSYNATLNVVGGLVTSTGSATAARLFCNSTTKENVINISGGTIRGSKVGFWVQLPGSSGQAKKATVNITGGKVEGGSYAWYDYSYGDVYTAVNYSITGGFFKGDIYSYGVQNKDFKALDGFISGGYFSEEISGSLVVAGKAVVDNTEEETKEEYPYVIGEAEVYYSWFDSGTKIGEYCLFAYPFDNEYLMDGEFIDVLKDINLSKTVECKLASGSFNLTFGDYTVNKGDYSVTLLPGVTVYTDKRTDIFSAATEGYSINEQVTETGYAYTCGKYVVQIAETGVKYEVFEEATAVLTANQTIKLLADVAMAENLIADKSFTIKTEGHKFNPAGNTITIAQTGVTVNVEIAASLIDNFTSAAEGYMVDEAVTTNGYAYSLKAIEVLDFADIDEGYYHIVNLGNNKYVNVLGRRTATVNTSAEDAEKSAGAVIKVKATDGKVEILRSQAVDIPHYASRAMSYVPSVVRMLVGKLRLGGSGNILGETGADAILEKFNQSVDPNLYVENVDGGYRIFGRTPSMQPVLEFYQENKANVDAKLPMLEETINNSIALVVKRTGMGESFKDSFKLHTIWERMGAENLTEPVDDASKLAFLQEVLSSQNHVWNFAYQTATFYMEKVEGSQYYNMMPDEMATYWNKIKQIHPNFKYYIVQKDGKMDIISEGNADIINNSASAVWKLEPVTEFTLNVPESNWKKNDEGATEYYTTIYTDFGYQLPEGAVAMKVTGIQETTVAAIESDCVGLAETEEIGQQVAPQTPVLIKSKTAGDITLTIGDNYGTAIDEGSNLLHGVDWLINNYEVNSPTVEGLFTLINSMTTSASETYDYLDQHEYLQRLNSGTVNNKYFFGLDISETFADAYEKKTGTTMEKTPIRVLGMIDGDRLVFNESWDDLISNRAFIFSEEYNPVVFSMLYVAENVEKEKGYETIEEAFSDVEDGQTIRLLDNVSMASDQTADKSFTLKTEEFTFDPAGHTITIAQTGVTVNVEIAASIIDNFDSSVDGFKVEETVIANGYAYSLVPVEDLDLATIEEGYYNIKNVGNSKYVNVKGRKTATVDASEATSAGTVIKVKATEGKVEILRSQAVDIPSYAQRAMRYVPEVVTLVVDKLGVDGSGKILGETGVDAILEKFYDEFDPNLYVENVDGGYRIFGRTPSMQPVLDFYKENKANVDAKLPELEQAVNDAIALVVDKLGMGASLKDSFKLHTIWERMGATNLTEPVDDASKLSFLQEVLSSKNHVWNFAYQTATFYADEVEGKLDQIEGISEDMDVSKYIELAKKIRPDFKYYIVQNEDKMDIISEGNIDIINNADRAVWQIEAAETMTVNVPEENSRVVGAIFDEDGKRTAFETGYYTTLYTDFAYQLPEGVVALKVTEIKDTYLGDEKLTYEKEGVTLGLGLLKTEEIGQEVPAQTPVLIMSKTAEPFEITIGDDFGASADVSGNLLRGADYLIEQYEINTPVLEGLFEMVKDKISSDLADKYEHLIRKYSGTVNNKFFFSLNINDELATAYQKKTGNEMKTSPVLVLSKQTNKKLAFNESWDDLEPNSVFLFSEENKPVLFTLTGDVTRDGIIDVDDVTGQVNIVQERDKKEYNYDYEAADIIIGDTYFIDVDDVTGLTNIIQKRVKHPDLP